MATKIAIIKETAPAEKRVAATPETVKKLIAAGCSVIIEQNAGNAASYTDAAYQEAGADIAKSASEAIKNADIILRVQIGANDSLDDIKSGALLIGLTNPSANAELIKKAANKKIDLFSMELVPRISRAQAMDVLSSQSNLAGYKSVLDATEYFTRAFPMMMTAAGTIPPAKVFIMGAGVAGLQAIATAKRLGASVSATDVRPAAKEQVKSLGASFVAVENDEFKEAESTGGYAKEMSKDYQQQQAELVAQTIAKQDIVITTALIPGRPAPRLITDAMVQTMKHGSVIVDMAVEAGGNVEGSKLGEVVVTKNGVTILGHQNIASRLATDASALYARNILNLINLIIDDETKSLAINWDDDIIRGIALTKDGKLIHPNFGGEALKTEESKP